MGSQAMTLDESVYSDIDTADLYQEVYDAAYHGVDIRHAWIGAHRPQTSVESLRAICRWASTHYDYYLNFVRDYMERRGDVLDVGCGRDRRLQCWRATPDAQPESIMILP